MQTQGPVQQNKLYDEKDGNAKPDRDARKWRGTTFWLIRANLRKEIEKLQRRVEIKEEELKRSKRIQTEQVQELQEARCQAEGNKR